MEKYHYETKEFGVTDTGIDLLRSRFKYETISFSQIHAMEIKRGRELNNWFAVLMIGLMLLGSGFYVSINIINSLLEGELTPRGARVVLLLFIPIIGGYFVYTSLQKSMVLKINYEKERRRKFSLREILSENRIKEFKVLMRNRVGSKLRVE